MKVLLAPLFFHQRMCKHCARIFYKRNPGGWLGLYELERLPPLGTFDATRGFLPDLPALLMFDEFVVDGEALDRLRDPGDRAWLAEWSSLVDALDAEGALTAADVETAARARARERAAMLRRDLRDVARWWQAVGYCETLLAHAARLLGDDPTTAQDVTWSFDPSVPYGLVGPDGQAHDPGVVLLGEDDDLDAHRALVEHAADTLRRHLREVNACLVACDELDVAPMMWAPYARYLEEKLRGTPAEREHRDADAARKFFEIAFPAYAPRSVGDFVRLRAHKHLATLRDEIRRAAATGDDLDPAYPQRVLAEVVDVERRGVRTRRIIGWIAAGVGSLPVPGLGLATTAAAEAASEVVMRRARKDHRWFYLVSDGRGGT